MPATSSWALDASPDRRASNTPPRTPDLPADPSNQTRHSGSHAAGAAASVSRVCGSGRRVSSDAENPTSPTGSSYSGLHRFTVQRSVPPALAFAGEEKVAPQLQIHQPPDAIRGIFDSRAVPLDQAIQLSAIDQRCQEPVRLLQRGVKRRGARIQ